jgi:glyoxylase-like metal-dependent hydrolase (beta-lactamase superfamily II)
MLVACGLPPIQPPDHDLCEEGQPVPWLAVAPSVWIWLPKREAEIDTANAGHVVPTSVVVDGGEALVIDPGPNHRHGLRVLQSLRCRFGARVTWVVNTHAHAENVMGNSAFADAQSRGQLRIAASRPTLNAMQQRCPDCLRNLQQRAGVDAMTGTRIVLPNSTLQASSTLRVGAREIQVLDVVRAHTEGDLLLCDAASGVLWAGGLVYGQRLPELAQGSLQSWLQALAHIEAMPVRELIGTTWSSAGADGSAPSALTSTRRYLLDLREGVLRAMDAGRLPQEADVSPLPAYADWAGYRERHAFNVMRAWRELEPVWMEQIPVK